MQKPVTSLLFSNNAEEAMNFYLSVFKHSKMGKKMYYGEGAPMPKGTFLSADFELNGANFNVINGPKAGFTMAMSIFVPCDTQEEIDDLWTKLTEGGEEVQCGWLKDKYGVSWQIAPVALGDMLRDKDEAKAQRAMQAMMQMKKLNIAALKRAYEGK